MKHSTRARWGLAVIALVLAATFAAGWVVIHLVGPDDAPVVALATALVLAMALIGALNVGAALANKMTAPRTPRAVKAPTSGERWNS